MWGQPGRRSKFSCARRSAAFAARPPAAADRGISAARCWRFLGFPLGGLEGGRLFLDGLQLLVRLAALGLGASARWVAAASSAFRASMRLSAVPAHCCAARPAWTAAAAAGGCTPARAAGPRWPVRSCKPARHFIKAEQAGTKTLFLNVHRFRRHGFLHPLAKIIKNACSGC